MLCNHYVSTNGIVKHISCLCNYYIDLSAELNCLKIHVLAKLRQILGLCNYYYIESHQMSNCQSYPPKLLISTAVLRKGLRNHPQYIRKSFTFNLNYLTIIIITILILLCWPCNQHTAHMCQAALF